MSNTVSDDSDYAPYFRGQTEEEGRDSIMLQRAFELRYEVYCLECRFLQADEYPDGRESDEHDADSAHFYSHNLRDELVGYVRLVPATEQGRFPWQDHCGALLDGVELPAAEDCAEISRLMVRRDYRRRRGDVLSGVNIRQDGGSAPLAGERRSESPQILLTLYRQMYQHCVKTGVRYWYAAMERPLRRSLQRMAFNFTQVGPETDYFGPVAPYVVDLRQLETDVGRANPALLAWMQRPDTPTN